METSRSTLISTQVWGLTMAYAERRERKKGARYRGVYKAADGRYCACRKPRPRKATRRYSLIRQPV